MRSFFKDRKDFAELYLDFFLNDDSQSFDEAMEKWKFPEEMLLHTIKAGASGYLLKDVSPSELVDAIRAAYRGETKLHPEVAKKLMERVAGGTKEPTPLVLRPIPFK